VSWQAVTFALLALVVFGGFAWYERSRPPARLIALVAALAALAIAGRLVLTPIPNVVASTDIALITGYALGAAPGFAVGALVAPVSNIWLGQGPWTAWEMAGWGLVGLAGAWLALLTNRRLGRIGLAVVCALAGLAYGALQDLSVMVTYGGEQSLDRYLALSARGIPFNVAHATGNFAIALMAGPALVRMISRFRTRLEFRWRPARSPAAARAGAQTLAVLVAVCAALAVVAPSTAAASTRSWLEGTQNEDGGFAASEGQPSSPAMTAWVMLGIEAAGRNPLDVTSGGTSPVGYMRDEIDRVKTATDLERTILALAGAGVDPRSFEGRDLVSDLRREKDDDGSVNGQVNMTAFYILALRGAGVEASELKRPLRWLRGAQNTNGGWGFQPEAQSDPDSTGAALQALGAAGADTGAATDGVRYLRRAQSEGGGFALATSGVVNAQSTAWAAQGMIAVDSTGSNLDAALAYLAARRAADGHYRYSAASDQTPVWVTAQVLLAVNRAPLPLAAVARAPQRSPEPSGSGTGAHQGAGGGASNQSTPLPGPPSGSTPLPAPSGSDLDLPKDIERKLDHANANGGGKRAHGEDGILEALSRPEAASGDTPKPPFVDEGRPVVAGDEGASDDGEDREPAAPYVVAGLGGLAAALALGFLWYRRRLP
jgi:energy-coupling factor transport system substrate-specific component